ncbi:hypothetical protein O4H49_01255 [Kiloniella laminariae]|uniref:DUF304 domain-containing protein n=1 Tax=Kiloniella laminariae TaxID=454162 RepID=A0ABT4LE59_9PROT|nr:hypothetical protein [Kiloniella laminariae]MCZ4279383.1 hypothetical protein [Kiloniella laminariae]
MNREDNREFVLEALRANETLCWFDQPKPGPLWKHERATILSRSLILIWAVLLFFCGLMSLGGVVTIPLLILLLVASGALILRLIWICYLTRRLTYVLTSKRLLVLLEAGRPIEYKSYSLSRIFAIDRRENPDGSGNVLVRVRGRRANQPDETEGFYGIEEAEEFERELFGLCSELKS